MSMMRRRMMCSKKETPLTPPTGYSFTEYTKRAYDTGIVPNGKIVELDFRSMSSGNFYQIFGVQGNYCFYQAPWTSAWIGFLNSSDSFGIGKTDYTTRHTVRLSPVENKVYFDEDTVVSTSATHTDTAFSFYINAIRSSSGTGFWYSSIRGNEIYSLKVWDGATGDLELYALPVKADATGTVRLYDFVQERFLNEVT